MPKLYRYVPLLRSKAGEADALTNLAAPDKQRLFPIIHISATPAAGFLSKAGAAWTGLPIALDGTFNFGFTGSIAGFTALFNGLGHAGVRVIPSIECNSPAPYVTGVARYIGRFAPGLVVKATLRQLTAVSAWVVAQGWQTSNVDLVIMAGHAADYDPNQFADFVALAIKTHISNPQGWRTITLASSAAPKDTSALAYGRNDIPRLDWDVSDGYSSSASSSTALPIDAAATSPSLMIRRSACHRVLELARLGDRAMRCGQHGEPQRDRPAPRMGGAASTPAIVLSAPNREA